MHILYVADGDYKYGAQNSLFQLISEILKIDNSVMASVILTRHSDKMKDFQELSCAVYQISYEPFYQTIPYEYILFPVKYIVRGLQYMYGRVFALHNLEKQLDLNTVDLIHSNSSREDFSAAIAAKYGIPLVRHIREFGDYDYQCYSYRKNYISFMNEHAAFFVAISKAVMQHWIEKGISKEKVIQIYNGVEENSNVKENYPKAGGMIRLIMMGSVKKTKGQHDLIQAIALLTGKEKERIRLDIVGDGPAAYITYLKRLIKKNHLKKQIDLLGYHKDYFKNLYKYDCGIMCSKCEGFGRVTVEYMMAGLPVIASNKGANVEIVEDGVNGLLYEQESIEQLSGKIRYLLNNEECIEKMGHNAYLSAKNRYTAHMNASRIFQLYVEILTHVK